MTRCLFLDRDGVVNVDRHYVHRQDDFVFMPGIFELVRFATQDLGWLAIVVTNQSGIGRGYYDEATFLALTDWMLARFAAAGAPIARVYHCPYHPTEGVGAFRQDHPWRKPKPGMLLAAAADFGLDMAGSAMVGNSADDMAAAEAAGVGLRIQLGGAASAGVVAVASLDEARAALAARQIR